MVSRSFGNCKPKDTKEVPGASLASWKDVEKILLYQQAVYEDVALKKLVEKLSEHEGELVRSPSYDQVYEFLKSISQEAKVINARSGLKHTPGERTSSHSFMGSFRLYQFPDLLFSWRNDLCLEGGEEFIGILVAKCWVVTLERSGTITVRRTDADDEPIPSKMSQSSL
jgi:hypothetical protein